MNGYSLQIKSIVAYINELMMRVINYTVASRNI